MNKGFCGRRIIFDKEVIFEEVWLLFFYRIYKNSAIMDPMPYYYDSIDRNAIVVRPKKPLFDWINAIYPDNPVEAALEGTVYLVKERDSNEEIEKWLQKNFDSIFQDQLNGWHTDEKDWPKNRSYHQFTQWFALEIHSMILDLEDEPITKG